MINQGGMKVISTGKMTVVGKICRSNKKDSKPSLRLFIPKAIADEVGWDYNTFVAFYADPKHKSVTIKKVNFEART